MKREPYYMVDIETTGTDKDDDEILQIAVVPIQFEADGRGNKFWLPTYHEPFNRKVYSDRQPTSEFAKKHMTKLYAECNALNPERDDIGSVSEHLRIWLHGEENYTKHHQDPKFFMGWNASNFDLEFLFRKGALHPTYYLDLDGKGEKLYGDAHYRVYEQTGAIEFMLDITGLSRKVLMDLALEMCPDHVKIKNANLSHDAVDDCYYQINLMNGLLELGRRGWKK